MFICANAQPQSVRLTNVYTLTLRSDKMTTSSRGFPISQLSCTGAYCNPKYMLSAMQCYNTGHDGLDVNWKCEAQVDPKFKLDKTVVNCEGFTHPDDPYVLVGSCGATYSLIPTPAYLQTIYHNEISGNTEALMLSLMFGFVFLMLLFV